jgi:hypothetical protein
MLFFKASEFLFTYGSLRHLVGLLGWGISPASGQYDTEKHRHTSMPRAGFKPATPMFEWPKTVIALDSAAIETDELLN